ncbi:galanin receptor type 2 [Petaurus breviceps papuanus]|uniref:galanin receptor type 2 n=1 Tax=Petaurus breviceps papuanus TaxID=3040969 RepID=UPI0036D91A2E
MNASAALENAMLFALIFLVGTAGNSLVLAVLLRSGQMSSTTNLFILNLGDLDGWVFALLCKAVHFLIFLTMYASSFTLASLSRQCGLWPRTPFVKSFGLVLASCQRQSPDVSCQHRYLAIRYPLHFRELRTPRNGLAVIGLIWTLALIFLGPYLSYYSHYLLRALVLGLTYVLTLRYLWRIVDPVAALSVSKPSKGKVTRMIVTVATLFCLCWMPHHALILSVCVLCQLLRQPCVYALVSKHFRKICEGLLFRSPQLVSRRVRVAPTRTRRGSLLVHDSIAMVPVCKVADPTILTAEYVPPRDSVLSPLPGPSWRV